MVKHRLIFALLLNKGQYMMSRNFRLQTVGDLNWIKKHYDFKSIAQSIDELVVLNVEKQPQDIPGFAQHLAELVKNCFMPVAAGGGIRSLEDAFAVLNAGADKLVLNAAIHNQPDLVRALVKKFGSQCIVASIDYRMVKGKRVVFTAGGTLSTDLEVPSVVSLAQSLGAGEIYLTSIDQDGTGQGYDFDILKDVSHASHVPIIASGGVGRIDQLAEGIERANVQAVSTANLFNFMADGLTEARLDMAARHIDLARWDFGIFSSSTSHTASTSL
jgi:cyclase